MLNQIILLIKNQSIISTDRNMHFDGWRGMAIVMVLISHFLTIPGFYSGKFGVASFFVLSGALMSNILFVKKTPLAQFYKRRISRILPVFFIYVSAVYLYGLFTSAAETSNYLYTLSFIRAYVPASPDMWSTDLPINHLWSLNVEEHCYILLSLITLFTVLKNKEFYLLFFLGLGAAALFGLYVHNPGVAPPLFSIRTEAVASFLLLSAGYFLIRNRFDVYVSTWAATLAFTLAAACFLANLPWYYPFLLAPILLAFSFHHMSKFPAILLAVFAWKPLRLMGIWSYSIYLWQHPIYYYFVEHATSVNALESIFYLIIAICIGLMSYYLIESPIRKYMNENWT